MDSPTGADVVVVGAGLFGTSIAYQLARDGASVLIVDRRGVCQGDSRVCFGMLRRHYSNEATARLAVRGIEILAGWAEEVEVGESGYVPTGYLLTVPRESLDALRANVTALRAWGVDTREVTTDEISELEPLLRLDGIAGGAYEPDGGFADPQKVSLSWFTAATSRGARFVGATARRIVVDARRARGVETDRGKFGADVVVDAAGAWGQTLASAGVALPVALRRIQVAFVRQSAENADVRVTMSDMVSDLVVRPDRAGIALAVVYGPEERVLDRDDCDERIDPWYERAIRSAFAERLPAYAESEWLGGFAGTYDYLPDWNPVLGWAPEVAGLYIARGSGHGFKLAPAVGEVAADEIIGRKSRIDVTPLRPTRFEAGSTLRLAYGPSPRA